MKKIKEIKHKKAVMITLIVVLILLIVGITYAAVNFDFLGGVNTITADDISIEFLESNEVINVENALPMIDGDGIKQEETFDFVVTTKARGNVNIKYDLMIEKLEVDEGKEALNDDQIKVYLTDYSDKELVEPVTIENLDNILYSKINRHSKEETKIQDKYKLRVWIDEKVDSSEWDEETNLQYKFRIGVKGEQTKLAVMSNKWKDKTENEGNYEALFTLDSKELPEQKEYDDGPYTKITEIDISEEENNDVILGEYQDEKGNLIAIIGADEKVVAPVNSEDLFCFLRKITILDLSYLDTSITTNMSYMFNRDTSLTNITFPKDFGSRTKDMSNMFMDCASLKELDLSNFNTSQVTNMSNMFYILESLTNITLPKDFGKAAEDMSDMFSNCYELQELDLSNLDTSHATNMSRMFSSDEALINITFSKNFGKAANDMSSMFLNCYKLGNLDLSNFDTSKTIDMSGMFSGTKALTNITFPNDFGKAAENMNNMFNGCISLQELDLRNLNTSQVTDMSYMFDDCESLQKLDLRSFNTSNVINIDSMFYFSFKLNNITVGCNWTLTDYSAMSVDGSIINKVCEE